VYATVPDLRAEGVTASQASDARLAQLIDEASRTIDRLTGWFFEPRTMTLYLDGRGTPSIEPPVPPISLSLVAINSDAVSSYEYIVVGAPVMPGFVAPRITILEGRHFPKGDGNVELTGVFGYTEPDGSAEGRTPIAIRRACMMLVMKTLPLLGDEDEGFDVRNRWRIIEEKTRDQSYKLDKPGAAGPLTGDPDVDDILLGFRRPGGLGAV
jgi:hypothetical protein